MNEKPEPINLLDELIKQKQMLVDQLTREQWTETKSLARLLKEKGSQDRKEEPVVWKMHCPWCLAKGIYDPENCMGSRDMWVEVGDQVNMTCGKCKEFFTIAVVRLEFPKDWKR